MVSSLQTIITRDLDPTQSAVLTVAHLEAGTTNNVIPASAFLEGTIRTFDEEVRSTIHEGLHRVAAGTASNHRCTCSSEVIAGYPVTANDAGQAELSGEVAGALLGSERFHVLPQPLFAAEDFSYVLNEVPGAMVMMGVCPDDVAPEDAESNHSNLMKINESAFYSGVGLYAAMAMAT
jgi:hippurate hydrolase